MSDTTVDVARARWREAEERLYPTLIADPAAAERAVVAIRTILAELRLRGHGISVLTVADAAADDLVSRICLPDTGFPAELLVGIACGVRLRELAAEQDHRRVERLIAHGRAIGRTWVVLDGPDDPDVLTEGRTVVVHVTSGTVLTATAGPWSDGQPYELQVHPHGGHPLSRTFSDRAEWLAEHQRCRWDVESLHQGPTPTGATTRTGAR
jgi:hypothetical protein